MSARSNSLQAVYARTLNTCSRRAAFAGSNDPAELKRKEAAAVWDEAGYEKRLALEKAAQATNSEIRLVREAYGYLGMESA